jgi:nitrogen-specific signal transduction histidine kinase
MRLSDAANGPAGATGNETWPAPEWGAEFWKDILDELGQPVLVCRTDGRLLWSNREASGLLGLEGLEGGPLPDRLRFLAGGGAPEGALGLGREVAVSAEGGKGTVRLVLKRTGRWPEEGLVLAAGVPGACRNGLPGDGGHGAGGLPPQGFGEQMALAGEAGRALRGPLAGIELYASILGEELDEAGVGGLSAILDEIRRSVREVNEQLTSLESMARPLSLDLRPWAVPDLVDEALEAMNGVFKSRGVGILAERQEEMTVECDRGLVVQAFLNILLNAAEAMPRGGRLAVREGRGPAGECEIVFSDSGPGVPQGDVVRIFNPFHTTKGKALGLGLPASRRVVEAHQGRIVFGNDDFRGARVKVVLPCIPAAGGARNLN